MLLATSLILRLSGRSNWDTRMGFFLHLHLNYILTKCPAKFSRKTILLSTLRTIDTEARTHLSLPDYEYACCFRHWTHIEMEKKSGRASLNLKVHSLGWGNANPAARKWQTGEIAQQVKVCVPKPTNPCLTPVTHMVEEESQLLKIIL